AKVSCKKFVREFEFDPEKEPKVGEEIKVDIFSEGESVIISGKSKGKGFEGVMKRHGFSGGQKTHGQSDRMRAPGSIGNSSWPSRVWKGMKMPGRSGNRKITQKSIKIVKIFNDKNIMLVKGAVPGRKNSLVEIRG
ncbi:50S ribosomal protein L3, partial [candidate division KSB1 bacterium]